MSKTTTLLPILPTSTSTPIAPIPTVLPTIETATAVGHRTLWVVFAIMLITTLVFYIMAFRVPVQKRILHVLTSLIGTFTTISYYALATGDGISLLHYTIRKGHKHIPDIYYDLYRQVYWGRYIEWAITTPIILLILSLLAGLNGANILVITVTGLTMAVLALLAALQPRESGWGYFAMACIGFLVVVYQLGWNGRATALTKDSKLAKFYIAIATYTVIIWLAYPIIGAIGQGTQIVSVDHEIIAYAVVDVLSKAVWGIWLLFTHDASPALSVSIEGVWAHGISSEGHIRVGDDDEGA